MFENIDYTVDEPIATITLNRPDRLNALTGPMLRELQEAVTAAEADERVVSILGCRTLAGTGSDVNYGSSFVAGCTLDASGAGRGSCQRE